MQKKRFKETTKQKMKHRIATKNDCVFNRSTLGDTSIEKLQPRPKCYKPYAAKTRLEAPQHQDFALTPPGYHQTQQ
jgi:hypothetical protein